MTDAHKRPSDPRDLLLRTGPCLTGGVPDDAVSETADGGASVRANGPADPMATPLGTPETARYDILTTIGAGGMGRVDIAIDRRLQRQVARKTPRSRHPMVLARLAQEALITAHLDHPGIVPVFDAGVGPDGNLFYSMRLVRGKSLEDALSGRTTLAERLTFLRSFLAACEAVAYAHAKGVVHRDLKPDNIMLGDFGETQIVDWGVAKPLTEVAGEAWHQHILPEDVAVDTMHGDIIGTPAYMAPEQAVAGAPPTIAADVFSLGAVLFRIIAGHPPIAAARDTGELLSRVREGRHLTLQSVEDALRARGESIPLELKAIVMRAMAPKAVDRYPDARTLAADVAAFLDGRRVEAYRYSAFEQLRRIVRTWRLPLTIAGIGLLVVAVVLVVAAIRVVDERDRAISAEHAAEKSAAVAARRLADSLIAQGAQHLGEERRPEAEVLAAQAYETTGDPEALGLLMATLDTEGPRAVAVGELPKHCQRIVLSERGDRVLCSMPDRVEAWVPGFDGVPPRRLWERAASHGALIWGPMVDGRDDARVTVVLEARKVAVLDADTGEVLHGTTGSDGRLDTSWDPIQISTRVHATRTRGRGDTPVVFHFAQHLGVLTPTGIREGPMVCDPPSHVEALALNGLDFAAICSDAVIARGSIGTDGSVRIGARQRLSIGARDPVPGRDTAPGHLAALAGDGLVAAITPRGRLHLQKIDATGAYSDVGVETGVPSALDMRIAPDGNALALALVKGGVVVLSLVDGEVGRMLYRLPDVHGRHLRWSDDGFVTAGPDRVVRWELPLAPGPQHRYGPADGPGLASVDISDDGLHVAVGGGGGRLGWYAVNGGAGIEVTPQKVVLKRVRFDAEANHVFHAGAGIIGLHRFSRDPLEAGQGPWPVGSDAYRRIERLGDGGWVGATWLEAPELVSPDGKVVGALRGVEDMGTAIDLDVSPDKKRLAMLGEDRWEVFAGPPDAMTRVTRRSDARAVAAGDDAVLVALRTSVLVYGYDGVERFHWSLPKMVAADVAVSRDGRYWAVGGADGTLAVWRAADVAGGLGWEAGAEPVDVPPLAMVRSGAGGHADRIGELMFGPDALWTASWDGTLRRWGLAPLAMKREAVVEAVGARWAMGLEEVFRGQQ